jgi:hypothetical protein
MPVATDELVRRVAIIVEKGIAKKLESLERLILDLAQEVRTQHSTGVGVRHPEPSREIKSIENDAFSGPCGPPPGSCR